MSSLDFLTIRQYAFVVRLDIQHFCSSSLSTNILGIGMKKMLHIGLVLRVNIMKALDILKNEDAIFVFGSLYLASQIREKLKNFKP